MCKYKCIKITLSHYLHVKFTHFLKNIYNHTVCCFTCCGLSHVVHVFLFSYVFFAHRSFILMHLFHVISFHMWFFHMIQSFLYDYFHMIHSFYMIHFSHDSFSHDFLHMIYLFTKLYNLFIFTQVCNITLYTQIKIGNSKLKVPLPFNYNEKGKRRSQNRKLNRPTTSWQIKGKVLTHVDSYYQV